MSGTRFRLFPQPQGYSEPEIVTVSGAPGSIVAGPADWQLRAILPVDKRAPYAPPSYVPPYAGACLPPALPDAAGQFDHIPTGAPEFLPAHLFGCVRRTLDVWEHYLGRPVTWWHADAVPQLELVALLDWDNAQSGPGFIETGSRPNRYGERPLFCLNFDVVAHETGHAVLFSELGVPPPEMLGPQFLGFHEAFSDLTALLAALHFPTVVDRLLAQTGGNLYALNLVGRIGELSDVEQIRSADNTVTMVEVAGLRPGPDGEWIDPAGLGRNAHALAEPLTGAMFDVLVEVFQDGLVARGAIPSRLDPRRWSRAAVEDELVAVQAASDRAYAAFGRAFRAALADARDFLGRCMAQVLRTVRPEGLSYDRVAGAVIEAALAEGHGHQAVELVEIFALRGIGPALPVRAPLSTAGWRRLPYAERRRRVAAAERRGHGGSCGCDRGGLLLARAAMTHPQRRGLVSAAEGDYDTLLQHKGMNGNVR